MGRAQIRGTADRGVKAVTVSEGEGQGGCVVWAIARSAQSVQRARWLRNEQQLGLYAEGEHVVADGVHEWLASSSGKLVAERDGIRCQETRASGCR